MVILRSTKTHIFIKNIDFIFLCDLKDSLQTLKASLSSNMAMFTLSFHSNLNLTGDFEYYD